MKPTKQSPAAARKAVKVRKMILLHERSGVFIDYTLHPNATEANISKMAAECSNRKAILTPVFVLPATPEAVEGMELAAHKAIASDPDYANIAHHQYLDLVGTVFKSLGLSHPSKKSK